MKVWEAAIEVLRETGNPAVMWGDYGLCHLIATKLDWEHDGSATPKRVLQALSKTPGELVKRYTSCGRHPRVLIFLLPEEAKRREDECASKTEGTSQGCNGSEGYREAGSFPMCPQ